ncbi:molybdopterin biosynthesis protein MoeB [Exophiala viscosa]|uniref:Molybdopterin biosynthesis protein MoeB n=1 Tax=Exophiala viscosa TaxID=2486360 RepID=A0AAN6E058_9EURO|nr:molybdopterin biosynthesis protein MoeB [Exophiala viscosa]
MSTYLTISPSRVTTASLIPAPALASSRYNRQLLVPQLRLSGQNHLLQSRVLIIGLGGLGCPAALYLAGAGVGRLGLMDGDTVELGNLHRQIAHTESAARQGLSKVKSAAARCHEINSTIEFVLYETRATAENILGVVKDYDIVLDCSDNPATRYLVSDACVASGKVLVSGAAQRGEGSLIVLNSPPTADKGPCYRCVFPRPPPPEMVRGCSEIGILGPVVGTIGTLMAGEAIKIIARGGHLVGGAGHEQEQKQNEGKAPTPHTMLLYNTYAADPKGMFRTITLRGRRKDCLACGDDEALAKKGLDYQAFCGVVEDVKVLDDERRIDAADLLRGGKPGLVVDVREEHEYELGTKVDGSVNIPISKILRLGGGAFDELERLRDGTEQERGSIPVYFVCQRGNDSQIAAQKLIERVRADNGSESMSKWGWIGDVKGGFLAMEKFAVSTS